MNHLRALGTAGVRLAAPSQFPQEAQGSCLFRKDARDGVVSEVSASGAADPGSEVMSAKVSNVEQTRHRRGCFDGRLEFQKWIPCNGATRLCYG